MVYIAFFFICISVTTNIYASDCWSSCIEFFRNNSIIYTHTQIRMDRITQSSFANQTIQRSPSTEYITLAQITTNQINDTSNLPQATIIPAAKAHQILQAVPEKPTSYKNYYRYDLPPNFR